MFGNAVPVCGRFYFGFPLCFSKFPNHPPFSETFPWKIPHALRYGALIRADRRKNSRESIHAIKQSGAVVCQTVLLTVTVECHGFRLEQGEHPAPSRGPQRFPVRNGSPGAEQRGAAAGPHAAERVSHFGSAQAAGLCVDSAKKRGTFNLFWVTPSKWNDTKTFCLSSTQISFCLLTVIWVLRTLFLTTCRGFWWWPLKHNTSS